MLCNQGVDCPQCGVPCMSQEVVSHVQHAQGEAASSSNSNNGHLEVALAANARVWLAPQSRISGTQNSWLYCPLFLDAAGMLGHVERQSWEVHGISRHWWVHTREILANAPARQVREIREAMHTSQASLQPFSNRLNAYQADEYMCFADAARFFVLRNGYFPPRGRTSY